MKTVKPLIQSPSLQPIKKSIKWRKWIDPFKFRLDIYNKAVEDGEIEEDPESWKEVSKRAYKGPVILGPFGAMPLKEETLPSNIWDFWIGDVNFPITPKVYDAMKKTPGVDHFRQWTRYRFWLGVGSNFESADVKKAVEKNALKASGKQ